MNETHQTKLLGMYEIAALAKVTTAAVVNWRKRFSSFPEPIAELKSGPVFSSSQIEAWLRKRGKIMSPKIISMINLKGGVAKTTTTVGLAQVLSAAFGKRVLVIDLDPQTNATAMLIGETTWKELNRQGYTLASMFRDAVQETHTFDLEHTLQQRVSNITDVKSVDLLPSSIDLIDFQDELGALPHGRFYAANPIDILRRAVRPVLSEYDYVLIDCPPNLGLITLNGLRISNGYIIPTIPDVLSTYGIPQIVARVRDFSNTIGEDIQPLGIVATKVRGQSTLHQRTLDFLRSTKDERQDAPLFSTIFYENNQMGEAAEYLHVNTLRQKWGYQGQYERFEQFAREILEIFEED